MKLDSNPRKKGVIPVNGNSDSITGGDRNKLRWAALSLVIAGLSIWAVTSQWKNFSLEAFLDYVSQADLKWIVAAVFAMLGFVFFEGCALRSTCRALHYPTTVRSGFVYAASDIFFSAITPSATGGQPACAFLMMRDGLPGIVTTAVLLVTLSMYTLSILVIGLVCLLFRLDVLLTFGTPSRVLIGLGFAIQLVLVIFLLMLVKTEWLLERICRGAIHLLARLHIVRHEAERQQKLADTMEEYRRCLALLSNHPGLLVHSFVFNLLQRVSQISVTALVFLAMGGSLRTAPSIFAMQSFVVLGSNSVPVPGAMGVADFMMLDGFNAFLQPDQVVGMELLSRSLSFYSCVLLCGLVVLFMTYFKRRVRGK